MDGFGRTDRTQIKAGTVLYRVVDEVQVRFDQATPARWGVNPLSRWAVLCALEGPHKNQYFYPEVYGVMKRRKDGEA